MKKTVSTLSMIFLLIASSISTQAIAQKATGPEFKAEKQTVDFGSIPYMGDNTRELKFTNTGTEPLFIRNARGSCGCTVPIWPKDPIMPGQSNTIKIKYDTKRVGAINKSVTLTTNEVEGKDSNGNPIYQTHTIRVIGNVGKRPTNDGVPRIEEGGAPTN